MKSDIKKLNLEISFTSREGLKNALNQVKKDYLENKMNNSRSGSGYEYKSLFVFKEEMEEPEIEVEIEGRFEVFEGKNCLVIPSRLNYENGEDTAS